MSAVSLAPRPASRFYAPPSAGTLGDALAAFHLLMLAYANESAPEVRLLPGGEHVGFPITAEVPVEELRRRARVQLGAVGIAGELDRAQLTWRGAAGGDAFSVDWSAPDGPELARVTFPARLRFARRHWHAALAAVASPAAQNLAAGDVDLLDGQERAAILDRWSGADSPLPVDPAAPGQLHGFFEQCATDSPGDPALVLPGDEQVTYAELDTRANRLARHLRAVAGVNPGERVALLFPHGAAGGYVSLLAVLKCGAAYVPLDPGYPAARVADILADSGARTLLADPALAAARAPGFGGVVVCPDDPLTGRAIAAQSGERLGNVPADPDGLAYIIFTSGSTGRPKGVPIPHRAAGHFVRAEQIALPVTSADRVYQGFSLAFDASVEELWLAWANGAALVAPRGASAHAGPELAARLTAAGVTVLSCVPTFLAMLDADVPTVRLLILGGEECPPALVSRWADARPGRRMVNTYGPTEATVVATLADLRAGEAVTIGRPLPGYRAYVLDERRRPVPVGVPGELCLAGPILSPGYLNRPELTAEKFVADPFSKDPSNTRLYRTGDRARWRADGTLRFLGRMDGQVKIRGFRVELGEIDAALDACPGVRAATVAWHEGKAPSLVGYVVPSVTPGAAPFSETAALAILRARLPAYMVPARLEVLEELPLMASGKVDRRRLPAPRPRAGAGDLPTPAAHPPDASPPRTDLEGMIRAVWEKFLDPLPVGVEDDFFYDLGGHSLLAAQVVSELRRSPDARLGGISVADLYERPTVRTLAAKLTAAAPPPGPRGPRADVPPPVPPRAVPFLGGLVQAFGLYFVFGFGALQFLGPYLAYGWAIGEDWERPAAIALALATLLALYPAMLLGSVAVKWLVLGRYRAGSYPLWGGYYLRWWFVQTFLSVVPVGYLAGTPMFGWYLRLLGARIGRNVHLDTDAVGSYDLLRVGDDSCINSDASLLGHTVTGGRLILGEITVGRGAFVGSRAVLGVGASVGDGAGLEDLSLLPAGVHLPAGERWAGSPARRMEAVGEAPLPDPRPPWTRRAATGLAQAVGFFVFQALLLAALLPGSLWLNHLSEIVPWWAVALAAWPVAVSFILGLTLETAAMKWLLLGRVRPGSHPRHGSFAVRKWFVDRFLELSLDVLGPLYATLYLNPWYRLLGARLGRRAEVSTASFISPDLLEIGDESFVADSVSLGAARVEGNRLTVGPVHIGRRAFIGNSALLPPGTVIGDGALVGTLSVPPTDGAAARADTSWLGSPAMFLPQRQEATGQFGEAQTFRPTRALVGQRLAIEACRVTLPLTLSITLTCGLLAGIGALAERFGAGGLALLLPAAEIGVGLVAAGMMIAAKWLLVGRYQPGERPLWSHFVWRAELVAALHEYLANLWLVDGLTGTPFLAWFFRALGTRVGRGVYWETTELTEFDLVEIGDGAALNALATLQTHLFEDRVMKIGRVRVGPGATVGAMSLVLYDTDLGAGATLGDLSLLMKSETLPAATAWEGSPARRSP